MILPANLLTVLLVEDDPADVELTRMSLEQGKVKLRLDVVEDGVKAMDYLNQRGVYADTPLPDLVLLDLNLPRKDGRQVIEEIRASARLRCLPIVVLTTSSADADILRSYSLGANCYITKPAGFEDLVKIVRQIEDFWFTIVRLPTKARG
ncbi:MAG: response regulator [Elusimicrobia bacterium]|nr:response regulator [Elusimicrobiota bacterium]